MSILTKEQQDFVTISKEAHKQLEEYFELYKGRVTPNESHTHRGRLLSIIDDLQARAPKQYTEQELREAFDKVYPPFQGVGHEQIFKGWLMCAKSVGALKAEP